jgi:hypothetical protein
MQERGYKALTTFVKEATYHALRRHAADVGISHSEYLRRLAEEDLVRKGYLPGPDEGRRAARRRPRKP